MQHQEKQEEKHAEKHAEKRDTFRDTFRDEKRAYMAIYYGYRRKIWKNIGIYSSEEHGE